MCLGIPARIVEVSASGEMGRADVGGVLRDVNLALLDGPWQLGEYVLVHCGFALERISPEQAAATLAALQDDDWTSFGPAQR